MKSPLRIARHDVANRLMIAHFHLAEMAPTTPEDVARAAKVKRELDNIQEILRLAVEEEMELQATA